MAFAYEVKFLPEGRTEQHVTPRIQFRYVLPDGARVRMETQPVWCCQCGKLTEGEQIESMAEIDRRMKDLERPGAPSGASQQARLVELSKRRRWRLLRMSPPRCCDCGATEIAPILPSGLSRIPGTNRSIELKSVGIAGITGGNTDGRRFNVEGIRLEGKTTS